MKAPGFWYRPAGLTARLLNPLGHAYDFAGRWRRGRCKPLLVGVPVICVGNLVAGGVGKTPMAMAIAEILRDWGLTVHFLTRGYGGRLPGPVRVSPGIHDAGDVGDEALLLAGTAPTWVCRDRAAGALAACAENARALVLDDGFQNGALSYRCSILVVDGATGFGNDRVIPAGPLRESVERGLLRASALVIMGEDQAGISARAMTFAAATGRHLPVFHARLTPDQATADTLRGQRVLAFAGIGRPAKFFETLTHLGAHVIESHGFPDHHPYKLAEVLALVERAHVLHAWPVTTTKDFVRLPEVTRSIVKVLPVAVAWRNGAAFIRLLEEAIGHSRPETHSEPHSETHPGAHSGTIPHV